MPKENWGVKDLFPLCFIIYLVNFLQSRNVRWEPEVNNEAEVIQEYSLQACSLVLLSLLFLYTSGLTAKG